MAAKKSSKRFELQRSSMFATDHSFPRTEADGQSTKVILKLYWWKSSGAGKHFTTYITKIRKFFPLYQFPDFSHTTDPGPLE